MTNQPRRINDKVWPLDINGHVFAWVGQAPVFIRIIDSPDYFLAVFSGVDNLRDIMTMIGVKYDSIKRIDDQNEFLSSIPRFGPERRLIRIIVDPHMTADNKIRFSEIQRVTIQ